LGDALGVLANALGRHRNAIGEPIYVTFQAVAEKLGAFTGAGPALLDPIRGRQIREQGAEGEQRHDDCHQEAFQNWNRMDGHDRYCNSKKWRTR